jgi:hypothetical protein
VFRLAQKTQTRQGFSLRAPLISKKPQSMYFLLRLGSQKVNIRRRKLLLAVIGVSPKGVLVLRVYLSAKLAHAKQTR